MSARARAARRLASLLVADNNGLFVRVTYDRLSRRYIVRWSDGPNLVQMCRLVLTHADQVPQLDVDDLMWLRAALTDRSARPISLYPMCKVLWGHGCPLARGDSHGCKNPRPCPCHECACGVTP